MIIIRIVCNFDLNKQISRIGHTESREDEEEPNDYFDGLMEEEEPMDYFDEEAAIKESEQSDNAYMIPQTDMEKDLSIIRSTSKLIFTPVHPMTKTDLWLNHIPRMLADIMEENVRSSESFGFFVAVSAGHIRDSSEC